MRDVNKWIITGAAIALIAGCSGGESESDSDSSAANEQPGAAADAQLADLTGDAAHGEQLFGQCAACHTLDPGVSRVGPSLNGVVGRDAGSLSGFAYSPAMRASGISWTRETLFDFLANPQAMVAGNRMSFPGLRDPQDRADLIAYLETQ